MSSKIKTLIPYLIMCAVLTAAAVWVKARDKSNLEDMMAQMELILPKVLKAKGNSFLIDVRTAQEYKTGHMKTAYNIPCDRIKHEIPFMTSSKQQSIIVYCKTGRRAEIAKEALREIGYVNVTNLNHIYDQLESEKEKAAEKQ